MDRDNAYEMIGRVTVAWNRIEWIWDDIFLVLLDAPHSQARAIYYALANFGAQRDMTIALAYFHLSGHPELIKRIRGLSGSVSKAAGDRNAAIHSRYARSDISNTLSVISTGKYNLSDEMLSQQLEDSMSKFDALFDETWITLAAICTTLGRAMP